MKSIINKARARLRTALKAEGQSLVEMAIVTPLLIFMLIGLFEVGWGLRGYLTLVNANREITRFAIRPGYLKYSEIDNTQPDYGVGYERVRDYLFTTLSGQLGLNLDVNGTLIISHIVADTGWPCERDEILAGKCDCSKFDTDPNYGYKMDDLILYPGKPGFNLSYTYIYTYPLTTTQQSRIDFPAEAERLARENNKFNCELLSKTKGSAVPSSNNLIITELFFSQPQLFGFPLISNPFTDPVPMYTHTTMRVTGAPRSGENVDTIGDVCAAYPITFSDSIFDDPDNPTVPQSIDAFEGNSPGNFGWITWNPDPSNNSEPYVEKELKEPRMSLHDFIDVNDPSDTWLSIGDDVSTKPGVANSNDIDKELQDLVGKVILIPVYDNNPGNGQNAYYHISHFAEIRIDQICLPRNGSKCDGQNNKQIKATFLGYNDEACGTD